MFNRHSQWHTLWRAASAIASAAVFFASALAAPAAWAQTQRTLGVVELKLPGSAPQNLYAQSHALVIGASNYRNGWPRLPGVVGDIKAVAEVLAKQGFSVTQLMDPSRDQLDASLRNFVAQHGQVPANRLLVYFAGHGHTLTTGAGGRLGYIVPVDAPRPDLDMGGFKRAAYSMDSIEGLSKQIDSRHALFVFDSCFSGTIFRTRAGVPDNISEKTARPVRQFITSGDENQTVPDQSIFRRQLVSGLGEGEADLNRDGFITGTELGMFLEDKVTDYSRRAQTPRYGRIRDPDLDKGDFVFVSPLQLASLKPEAVTPTARPGQGGGMSLEDLQKEEETRQVWLKWQGQMKADFDKTAAFAGSADLQAKAWQRFLSAWAQDNPLSQEDDNLRSQATARQQRAEQQSTAQSQPQQKPDRQATVSAGQVFKDCADCPEMVVIPSGSFTMGSNAQEQALANAAGVGKNITVKENPLHRVSIPRFAMGKYEVTQGQWKAVMGSNPSMFSKCGDNCPVEQVSWNDIQQFIQKLNQKTGQHYRLPSEAEWEYAARGGSQTVFWWGDSISTTQANYDGDNSFNGSSKGQYRRATVLVNSFSANPFGLYNVHGNVWEWVEDCFHDNYSGAPSDGSAWTTGCFDDTRVFRGGSWIDRPVILRSAFRIRDTPDNRDALTGFRVARTAP